MGIRRDTGGLNVRFMPRRIVTQQNRSATGIGRKLYKTLCMSVQGQHSGRAERGKGQMQAGKPCPGEPP